MEKKQMNIIMIMTDQQHKYALGKLSSFVKTPNLDKLANNGTLFTNAYSNNPVCSPFRALLYSGRYSIDTDTLGNECILKNNEITLPQELAEIGYETSFTGKLHLGETGNTPVKQEYRAGHKHFMGYQCYNGFLDNVYFYDEDCNEHKFEGHRTDITTNIGIDRLRMLNDIGKPFLHTIFYQAPHYPEQPSKEFEKFYENIDIPMPEEYSPIEPYTPTFSPRSAMPFENCKDYKRYGGDIDMYLKLYYSMVTQIDYNIGRILDELEELGIADNTAIIFSADHGDMQGSHGLKNKCLPHERSCGIPLITYVPGIKQVPVVNTPVSAVDYYPTCLDIANVKSKKELRGKSLLSLIKGETKEHIDIYAECTTQQGKDSMSWAMLRDEKYKLVINKANLLPVYLFNMLEDKDETTNLIDNESYDEIKESMKAKLLNIVNKA